MSETIDLIAIDGGGSGTRLRAVGRDDVVLAEATTGPSSLTLGVDQAWNSISHGLSILRQMTGSDLCNVPLYCGLAGGRSVERGAQLRAKAPPENSDIVIVTDGFASLIGAHSGCTGIVLAIGTGVAAFALARDGRVSSASAWGFKIGDEGGGAWLGKCALSLLSRRMDGRDRRDALMFDRLHQQVGDTFNDIQLWLGSGDATRFATLTPIVIKAAEDGCPVATNLMHEATQELSLAISAVDDGGPVALLGGLAPIFLPYLTSVYGDRIVPPQGNALDGLVLMARNKWHNEDAIPATEVRHA